MNNTLANKIFKELNELFNDKQVNHQNKAIVASILSMMLMDKTEEESDEMLAKYLINLKEFFQQQEIESLLESMKNTEIGMFLSFIACGTTEMAQHHQVTKNFVVEQINTTIKEELKELANEQDLLAIESQIDQELTHFITEYQATKKPNYLKILKIFAAYLNNKNKISAQITEAFSKIAESHIAPQKKKSIVQTTVNYTVMAGLIGLGVAFLGGISLAEMIIPLTTGLITSLVVNKALTQSAIKDLTAYKSIRNNLEKKQITEKFKELSQEIVKEQELAKENTKDNSKNLDQIFKGKNVEFAEIKHTLKGVMSNECDLSINTYASKKSNEQQQKPGKTAPNIRK